MAGSANGVTVEMKDLDGSSSYEEIGICTTAPFENEKTTELVKIEKLGDEWVEYDEGPAKDAGKLTFEVYLEPDDTGNDLLEDAYDDRQKRQFRFTLPPKLGSYTWEPIGIVDSLGLTLNKMDGCTRKVSAQLCGDPGRFEAPMGMLELGMLSADEGEEGEE